MKVLILKALIDSYINHEGLVSLNNVLRDYNEIREEIENKKSEILWNILYKNNENALRQL